jgi:hypothetical protein
MIYTYALTLYLLPLFSQRERSHHTYSYTCLHLTLPAFMLAALLLFLLYICGHIICLYIRVCFHHFTSNAHDYVLTPLLPEGNEVAYVSYFLAARLIALISDGECNSRRRRSLMYACLLARCVCNVCRVIHLHYTACTLYAGIQLEIFECHSRTPSSHR